MKRKQHLQRFQEEVKGKSSFIVDLPYIPALKDGVLRPVLIKNKYWKLSMNIAKDFTDILVSREKK